MENQGKIPNIAIEAYILTVKWCLSIIVIIMLIFSGIIWHLHNKIYDPVVGEVSVIQDGRGNNQNVSKNKM